MVIVIQKKKKHSLFQSISEATSEGSSFRSISPSAGMRKVSPYKYLTLNQAASLCGMSVYNFYAKLVESKVMYGFRFPGETIFIHPDSVVKCARVSGRRICKQTADQLGRQAEKLMLDKEAA